MEGGTRRAGSGLLQPSPPDPLLASAIGADRVALNREMENLFLSKYVDGIEVSAVSSKIPEYIELRLLEGGREPLASGRAKNPTRILSSFSKNG